MSDSRIRSFLYVDPASQILLYAKRAIGIDLTIHVPGVDVFQLLSQKSIKLPPDLTATYHPTTGFQTLAALPKGVKLDSLRLLRQKLETLTLLNTNVQLLISVLEQRFTTEFANSIQVSPKNQSLLRNFLDDERRLLILRCRTTLQSLIDQVMNLDSIEDIQAFYKDFSDHTIVGDYSASNRGLI